MSDKCKVCGGSDGPVCNDCYQDMTDDAVDNVIAELDMDLIEGLIREGIKEPRR